MNDSESYIEEILETYSEEIRTFAQDLRSFLKEETKPGYELVGKAAQSFNIGYGFTTTAWDCFCAIIVYRKHINISFPSGASLSDPDSLLHGTGARVRHLKVKKMADLKSKAVLKLLGDARKNALFLTRETDLNHDGVTTVVKRRKD